MKRGKKSNWIIFLVGLAAVLAACFLPDAYYAGMLRSAGIAWGVIGAIGLAQAYHYAKPENQAAYAAKETERRIAQTDERKVMLRRMAGNMAYQVMFFLLVALSLVLALLRQTWVSLLVLLLWVFQYILGVALFRYYEKRL